ncbi:MAG: hypothetical protein ABI171_18925 [Collimonas sp.]|uniref:hypothetical protein n=1 Tax=Collimonas sp. TaxID=1963772 RepID=UPI003267266A
MKFTAQQSDDGVTERLFDLTVAGAVVPGVLWTPEAAVGPRPLLLIGHGGSQHKLFAPLAAYAKNYAKTFHYAVALIDGPGHGARTTQEQSAGFGEKIRQQMSRGEGLGGEVLERMMQWAGQAKPEWQAVLDAVQLLDIVGSGGPVGYLGLSMGALSGISLVADEPRIKAAVFGLAGLHEGSQVLAEAARKLAVPIEFLLQWDDEMVSRQAAMALFDAIGSAEKTLHANRGGHGGVPPFERAGWMQFFSRHLGPAIISP